MATKSSACTNTRRNLGRAYSQPPWDPSRGLAFFYFLTNVGGLMKVLRNHIQLNYATAGSLRAEDIPYDGSQSITTKVDAIASGALVPLAEKIASGSANIEFTTEITSLYDKYILDMTGVSPASSSQVLYAKVYVNGALKQSSGNYRYIFTDYDYAGGGSQVAVDSGAFSTYLRLCWGQQTSDSNNLSGVLELTNVNTPNQWSQMDFKGGFNNTRFTTQGANNDVTADVIDGLRIQYLAGNIAEGIFRLYGVAKP